MSYDFTEKSVKEFIAELSGGAPVPGGGGASALVGAVGAALGGMVASVTLANKRYADVKEEMSALKSEAEAIQGELLRLIDKDAEVFAPLAKAYGMPADTDEERAAKEKAMETSLIEAARVPLEMMRKIAEAEALMDRLADKGSRLMVSDAACGAIICQAGIRAAWLNVRVNTKLIKDEEIAAGFNKEGESIVKESIAHAEEIYSRVSERFEDSRVNRRLSP